MIIADKGVEQQRKVLQIFPKILQQKLKANWEVLFDEFLLVVVVLVFFLEHGVELEVSCVWLLLLNLLPVFWLFVDDIDVWPDLGFVFGQDQVVAQLLKIFDALPLEVLSKHDLVR